MEIELDKATSQPNEDGIRGKYRRNATRPDARAFAATFQCAVDRHQRPFSAGGFLYDLFCPLAPSPARACAPFELSTPANRARIGKAKNSAADRRGPAPYLALRCVGYSVSFLAAPAASWIDKAPYSLRQLQERLTPFKKPIAQVAQASGAIEKLTTTEAAPAKTPTVRSSSTPSRIASSRTPRKCSCSFTIIIILYFLLAYHEVFLAKLIKLMPTLSDKKRAVTIAHEIEAQISRYLFTNTLINLCLGIAVGATVGFLGLSNPIMWGVTVAVLNFIPYLGALTGIFCMLLGALLSFDSLGFALDLSRHLSGARDHRREFHHPLWSWVGRSRCNPVLVLLSLMFWGWMSGIVGFLRAVPILATFKIFCTHLKPMEPLAEFMS